MGPSLKRYSECIIPIGVAGIVWFSALTQASYDLWSASRVFIAISILITIYALRHYRSPLRIKLPLWPYVLIFLGTIWLSVYHSYDTNATLLEAWGWTYSFCIFYLVINTIGDATQLAWFLKLCALVMIPLALICLQQRVYGHPDGWGHWDIHATLINSLVLAGFAMNWFYRSWSQTVKKDPIAVLELYCCMLVLGLAQSWWSFMCLGLGFLFYYRASFMRWAKINRLLSCGIGGVLFIFLAALVFIKIHTRVGPYQGSSRFYYWASALKIWRLSPWTGVGLGGFSTAYPYFRTPGIQSTLFAHSFPLQWLAETGLVGVAGLIIFSASILFPRQLSSYSKTLLDKNSLQTTVFAILLYSLMSINMEYWLNHTVLLILLASLLTLSENRSYAIKPLWIALFSVSIWLVSPFWMRMLVGSQTYNVGLYYENTGNPAEAKATYLSAIAIDPYQADSYFACSRLYARQYRQSHSSLDLQNAISFLATAFHYQKNRTFLQEIQHQQPVAHD